MTGNSDEWFSSGVILYTETHNLPRIKIITKEHIYEMQASKFAPLMNIFSVKVDGEFRASRYDSFERFLELDKASKDGKCSERERLLSEQIDDLKNQINRLEKRNQMLKEECDDLRLIGMDD